MNTGAATTCANIAFIKYWGNRDPDLNLPANGSISMNLAGLRTSTQVQFDETLAEDTLEINGLPVEGPALERVARFLDSGRAMAGVKTCARVRSRSTFPADAGLASSAAAFAALALAVDAALGLDLSPCQLSVLARLGSGSAARSVPGGFVEWYLGERHADSYAESIAPPTHWELVDVIAIVDETAKPTGSTRGHALAATSPLQTARVAGAPQRLAVCRAAILERDFDRLVQVMELDSNLMHAAMMTSQPPLFYWSPATLALLKAVPGWRDAGLQVGYTVDAGANVHLICPAESAPAVEAHARALSGVQSVLVSSAGGPAMRVDLAEDPLWRQGAH